MRISEQALGSGVPEENLARQRYNKMPYPPSVQQPVHISGQHKIRSSGGAEAPFPIIYRESSPNAVLIVVQSSLATRRSGFMTTIPCRVTLGSLHNPRISLHNEHKCAISGQDDASRGLGSIEKIRDFEIEFAREPHVGTDQGGGNDYESATRVAKS